MAIASGGEFFKGRIEEVRIYNRALSAKEIQTDMNTPSAPSAPPIRLVGTDTIGPVTDSNAQGTAEAFQTYAGTTRTGSVISLSVYVDAGSTATQLIAGLYADKSGIQAISSRRGLCSHLWQGTGTKSLFRPRRLMP